MGFLSVGVRWVGNTGDLDHVKSPIDQIPMSGQNSEPEFHPSAYSILFSEGCGSSRDGYSRKCFINGTVER